MSVNKEKIMFEIISYLTEHPNAQDTLDGITQWWLLERSILRQSPKVKEALEDLVHKGVVKKHIGTDLQITYGLNSKKYKEIQKLVKNNFRKS